MNINTDKEVRVDIDSTIAQSDTYQVSNLGRIRNVTYFKKKTHQLSPEKVSGYICVKLKFNGKFIRRKVHRLVARAFLGLDYYNEKVFVCHKDDNRANANLDNLFLGSVRDNNIDCRNKGRGTTPAKKLDNDNVKIIKSFISEGLSNREIASKFSVHHSSIQKIRNGKTWSYI